MRRRTVRHFTLLELIVVMGILVLLSSVAIPAYSALFSGRKTTLAANKLNAAVMEARAYAVSNKVYTALVFLKENVSANSSEEGYVRFRLAELYHNPENSSKSYIWSRWANGSDYVLLPDNTMIPAKTDYFGRASKLNEDATKPTDSLVDVDFSHMSSKDIPDGMSSTDAKSIIFRPNGQLASQERNVIVKFVETNKYENNPSAAVALPLRIHWLTGKTKFLTPSSKSSD